MNNFDETQDELDQRLGTSYEPGQLAFRMLYETAYLDKIRKKHVFRAKFVRPSFDDLEALAQYEIAREYAKQSNFSASDKPRILILCNDFIRPDNLYISPFLYRRIKKYQDRGFHVDVIAYSKHKTPGSYDFDGINVLTGYVPELVYLLATQRYDAVAVHFFNPDMWAVARHYKDLHRFHLFLHGYEIRNWTRSFDPTSSANEVDGAISRSLVLKDFWRHILDQEDFPASFVFVSDWMRRSAEEDIGCVFPSSKSHVIHNFIETELYQYFEKEPFQRFKILMIRNFDKYQYGTDIGLEVLKLLKLHPVWDKLSISIFGEGKGLADFSKAFAGDSNVSIDNRYLSQAEMAEQHRSHGIFLVPTRFDSQGVARDEAMSSGLIPATNAVCAIPEFVDTKCALLAPQEDAHTMFVAIIDVVKDPAKFSELSRKARERIERTLSDQHTIEKELRLFSTR